MPSFEPRDPDFETTIRETFGRQRLMALIGARLVRVEPGAVDIELPFRDDLAQQSGILHAGTIAAIADSAAGLAAQSLMSAGSDVLSVEFKLNLLAPAAGERFIARGHVVRPGRTVTVCSVDVSSISGDSETAVATFLGTMIAR